MMMKLFFIPMALVSTSLQAKLIVLDELGPTRPIPFVIAIEDAKKNAKNRVLPAPPVSLMRPNAMPVVTTLLTPGQLAEHEQGLTLEGVNQTIAIVGNDELSLEWLRQNRQNLIHIKATLWMISARSQSDVDSLATIIPELTLVVATANPIASVLPKHYPLLIHNNRIYQ